MSWSVVLCGFTRLSLKNNDENGWMIVYRTVILATSYLSKNVFVLPDHKKRHRSDSFNLNIIFSIPCQNFQNGTLTFVSVCVFETIWHLSLQQWFRYFDLRYLMALTCTLTSWVSKITNMPSTLFFLGCEIIIRLLSVFVEQKGMSNCF